MAIGNRTAIAVYSHSRIAGPAAEVLRSCIVAAVAAAVVGNSLIVVDSNIDVLLC